MENFTKGYNDFLANYPRLEKISLCKKTFPALNEKKYIVAALSYTLSFDDIN